MEEKPMTMQEIQFVSLGILKKISEVCESNGFRYTLAYGTLIGAIRHKGFIPWDDDIDIQMPRPDYNRFLRYMVEHPIDNIKVFNHKYVKGYPSGISRICDMRYKLVEKVTKSCDLGIFVDVYPIDGLASSYSEAKEVYGETDILRANLLRFINKELGFAYLLSKFMSPRYMLSGLILRLRGLSSVQSELEKTASRHPFSECEYVGIPNWNWIRLVYKREWYEKYVKVQFEDSYFWASAYYDDILKAEYGDYMQLPPVEKRIYHHGYMVYKR